MSISALNNSYNAQLWGLDINLKENASTQASKTSTSSSSSSSKASSAYSSGNALNSLAAALSGVMDDMGLSGSDKISFQTLIKYRDKLQDEFTEQVRKGLTAAGVAEDAEFRLVANSDGTGVTVVTDHADKALIEKYFKDNPDMVKKFEQLQSLNKMEETRKTNNIDVKAIRERIQLESMTAWYSDNTSYMSFAEQGAAYYSGINTIA